MPSRTRGDGLPYPAKIAGRLGQEDRVFRHLFLFLQGVDQLREVFLPVLPFGVNPLYGLSQEGVFFLQIGGETETLLGFRRYLPLHLP